MNLVQRAVQQGGKLAPIVIPTESATGLMNPSVFVDDDGDILVNLRHTNYTLYHAENTQQFPSRWGPLSYLHPEKDQALRTINYIVRLSDDLKVTDYTQVEMLELHKPIWEFTGLEDARLFKWDRKYYLVGVRRDTTPNGQGRMEYSHIKLNKEKWTAKETKRTRIPAPGADDSYCEKNWVPVLDKPDHFVKWTSPTEIVKANPFIPECETVSTTSSITPPTDQRGSSQVIKWGDKYISITHEVNLYKNYLGQKDGIYRHRLCVWDDKMSLIGLSREPFAFLDGQIEFCAGAAVHNGDLLVSFGMSDNAAYVLRVPSVVIEEMILGAMSYDL